MKEKTRQQAHTTRKWKQQRKVQIAYDTTRDECIYSHSKNWNSNETGKQGCLHNIILIYYLHLELNNNVQIWYSDLTIDDNVYISNISLPIMIVYNQYYIDEYMIWVDIVIYPCYLRTPNKYDWVSALISLYNSSNVFYFQPFVISIKSRKILSCALFKL